MSILLSGEIFSQIKQEPVNRILFVFDASQSMLGRWQSGRKIDIAKQLLTNITDSLKDVKNLELGLRVYGHQRSFPPQDCDDTRLEINFIPSNVFADRIKGKLSMIRAKGTTPIAKILSEFDLDLMEPDWKRSDQIWDRVIHQRDVMEFKCILTFYIII